MVAGVAPAYPAGILRIGFGTEPPNVRVFKRAVVLSFSAQENDNIARDMSGRRCA